MFRAIFLFYLNLSIVSAVCPTDLLCDPNYPSCYKYVNDEVEYVDAEERCINLGGHLASINNVFEGLAIGETAQSMFDGAFDFWIGANRLQGAWSWTDGSPWGYTNWYAGQPGISECGSMLLNDSTWIGSRSNSRKPFVCALPHPGTSTTCPVCATCATCHTCPPPAPTCSSTPTCASGWVYNSETKSCYKVLRDLTFSEGVQECNNSGAHLASIHSEEENLFIFDLTHTGFTGTWAQQTAIGLYKIGTNWYWRDGSEYDYYPWADGEPDNYGGNEDCGMLYSDYCHGAQGNHIGRWNDYPCTTRCRALVCKKPSH